MREAKVEELSLTKADYGLDAPGVMRNLFISGLASLAAGLGLNRALLNRQPVLSTIFIYWGGLAGASLLATSGLMLWSSRVGKLNGRREIIGALGLRGDETVLDVGCGRGLLLIEAARNLPHGKAVGIDLWRGEDLSGNQPEVTLANAALEGVAERVEVHTGDMRKLPFDDGSIDAVVANLSIHNLPTRADRDRVLAEIDRVLKPGGRIAIADFINTDQYMAAFQALVWTDLQRSGILPFLFPPSRLVTGKKPG